jgi:tetratricopeptide (TPR) repeat protein
MKKLNLILFIVSFILIPIGLMFRIEQWPYGSLFFTLGLLGLFIYYTVKTIKDFLTKRNDKLNIVLQIFIVLMSLTLFTRYLYHRLGDYPGLLIVPLFIFISVIYLTKRKLRDYKLSMISILYLILSIPLFGLEFHKSPRQYIPKEWYNKYDVSSGVQVSLPYEFRYYETEQLSINAFELRNNGRYFEAIIVYKEARKLEPRNPILLFDLSETYARINDLVTAIALLDTAILVDDTYAGFYNNRGLLYYKLKENDKATIDYKKAIQIDSTQYIFYANLALVYYYDGLYEESCESIKKAVKLGFNVNDNKELKLMRDKYCE